MKVDHHRRLRLTLAWLVLTGCGQVGGLTQPVELPADIRSEADFSAVSRDTRATDEVWDGSDAEPLDAGYHGDIAGGDADKETTDAADGGEIGDAAGFSDVDGRAPGSLDGGLSDGGLSDADSFDADSADGGAEDVSATDGADGGDGGWSDSGAGGGAVDVGDPKQCPFGQTVKDLNCGFQGVCAGHTKLGCFAGTPFCDYAAAPEWQTWETWCDGLDNDCDGYTDNNLARPTATSWPKTGVCAKALQVCGGPAGWIEPVAWQISNYEAVEVSCDGLDNDCDGITDADIDPKSPAAKIPKTSGKGVCAGLAMVCDKGIWVAPSPASSSLWEVNETSCDGLDNDCDGQIDESLIPPTPLPNGAVVLRDGVCSGAKAVCWNGSWQAPNYYAFVAGLPSKVTLTYEAVEVSCDGVDNDCDGATDEGLIGPLANQQLGVCKGARKVCKGGWAEPDYTGISGYGAGPETGCDGGDNNCDGVVDEAMVCPVWQLGGRNSGGIAAFGDHVVWAAGAGVVVHSAKTGTRLATHLQHEQPVLGLALSPDGKRLATVGASQVLRVRRVLGGTQKAADTVVDAPGKTWTAVAFDPAGKRIATTDAVGWLRVLPLPQAQGGLAKKLHSGPVRRLLWLATGPLAGARLLSGDDQGKLIAWRPNTLVAKIWTAPSTKPSGGGGPSAPGPIRGIAANPAGTRVAVAWRTAGVVIFNPQQGQVLAGPLLPGKALSAIGFDPQGRLWVGDESGDLRRFQPGKPGFWSVGWTLAAPKGGLELGPIQGVVATAAGPLWVAARWASGRRTLQGGWSAFGWPLRAAPRALATSAKRWLIGDGSGRVEAHGWAQGQRRWSAVLHAGKATEAIALRAGAGLPNLASGGGDGTTRVGSLSAPPQPKLSGVVSWPAPAATQRLTWHGGVLYRGVGNQLHGFDLSGGGSGPPAVVFQAQLPTATEIDDLAADSAGQRLAVTASAAGGSLRVLSISTAKPLWIRGNLASPRRVVAWRADGTELLVSGGSVGVQVVSAATGKTVIALPGHLAAVSALAWSGDGKRLLTASRDGAVRLWQRNAAGVIGLTTRVRHCRWPCTAMGGIIAVGFRDPAGKAWVSVAADGGVIGWRFP